MSAYDDLQAYQASMTPTIQKDARMNLNNRTLIALAMGLLSLCYIATQCRSCEVLAGPVVTECLKKHSPHECLRTHLP